MRYEKEAADHKKKNDLMMHREMLVKAQEMNKGSSPEAKNNLGVIQTKLAAIDKELADLKAGITPKTTASKHPIVKGLSKLSYFFKEIKETHQVLHPKSENTSSLKK